jgi:hypothetical protein
MSYKILAAALRAAADALDADESPEAAPAAKTRKKAAAATEPAQPAAAPAPAATAPVAPPAPPPAAPSVSKEALNKLVVSVAKIDRDTAVKILAKFQATNTANLKPEQYQAVYDEFEEAKAQLDARATQVADGSLV